MIIKVQLPVASTEVEPMALAYNEDRSFDVYMPVTKVVKKAMNGSLKKFFFAHYDEKTNNTVLQAEAPWQDW